MITTICKLVKAPYNETQKRAIKEAKELGIRVLVGNSRFQTDIDHDCSATTNEYAYPSGKIRRLGYLIID